VPPPFGPTSPKKANSFTPGTGHDGLSKPLAGFLAYECQAAEVARAKADGLERHYGSPDAAFFWAHHAEVDTRHGQWAGEALASIAACQQRLNSASGPPPMAGGPSSTNARLLGGRPSSSELLIGRDKELDKASQRKVSSR